MILPSHYSELRLQGNTMRKLILTSLALTLHCCNVLAQTPPLKVDAAFLMSASQGPTGVIELKWKIAPGYYLYRDHIRVTDSANGTTIGLDLPAGVVKTTSGVGSAVVYYDQVSILVAAADGKLKATYQGCRENSICYPPITKIVDAHSFEITDQEGKHAWLKLSQPDDGNRTSLDLDSVQDNVHRIALNSNVAQRDGDPFLLSENIIALTYRTAKFCIQCELGDRP